MLMLQLNWLAIFEMDSVCLRGRAQRKASAEKSLRSAIPSGIQQGTDDATNTCVEPCETYGAFVNELEGLNAAIFT
jgi:hypothetical protein